MYHLVVQAYEGRIDRKYHIEVKNQCWILQRWIRRRKRDSERESRWCLVIGGVSQECILFILFLFPQKFWSILLVTISSITIHFEHFFPDSKVKWGHWTGFLYKLFLSLIRFTTLWFCLPTGRTWKMPAGCRSTRTSSPRRSKSCMTSTLLAPKSGSTHTHKQNLPILPLRCIGV